MTDCIFPADITDTKILADVAELKKKCFGDAWSAASINAEAEAGRLWVAVDGEELAGYIVFWTIGSECEIANIAVAPEYRRRGIAGRLLNCAYSGGAKTFYLEVRESNWAARALYDTHGFTPYARRRNYYKNPTEDAILLSKEI